MREHDELIDDWIVCWSCGGTGEHESCPEDTCVCLEPPCCAAPCDICKGEGGWSGDEADDDAR